MGRNRGMAWSALTLMLLTACSGGGDEGPDATGGGSYGNAAVAQHANPVVVRYDRDRDTNPDVVTLDASHNPLVIVEALRGTTDGGGVDVTETWRGGTVDLALNDALLLYLAESFSVGSETDLDLTLDGKTVRVTVFE